MSLFANIRRAWKRHDQKLAEQAYRDEAGIERLESLDTGLRDAEVGSTVFGGPMAGEALTEAEDEATRD